MRPGLGFALVCVLATACGGPAPECDPSPGDAPVALSCERAVDAARGTLPPDHERITRVQFLYGSFQATTGGPLLSAEDQPPAWYAGYVVFTFADGSREAVSVRGSDLTVTAGELTAY